MSSSIITFVQIGSSNRSADVLRVEWWRTVNAVGSCNIILRNTAGKYNGVFDVQDTIAIALTDIDGNNAVMFRGRVDGEKAVTLKAIDGESIWDEYVIVKGVDMWQDVLFHNDFDKAYPSVLTQIKDVLGDLFDWPKEISTNISYTTPLGNTPVVGSTEFREGTSFLSTLQDTLQKAEWVSYCDDAANLRAGAPGFSATAEILTNTGADKNIIDKVDLSESDGGKLYNYIKIRGKNPTFDVYTEENLTNVATTGWTVRPLGNGLNSSTRVRVGAYSNRAYNTNPLTTLRPLSHVLTCPVFNYDSFDFSKGEIGCWAYVDNQPAGGGAEPAAGTAPNPTTIAFELTDSSMNVARYYGDSTRRYLGYWGWISAPLGEEFHTGAFSGANQWLCLPGVDFDWTEVIEIRITCPLQTPIPVLNVPSNFYIDGITLPISAIGFAEVAGGASASVYRKRPLVIPMTHISHQNALQGKAEQLLEQHQATNINYLALRVKGNLNLLYAGQSYTVTIPELGLNNAIFYAIQIHHVVEPRVDVSNGFGFDYITEIEGAPIYGVAYDMSRLGDRQIYSPTQLGQFSGTGLAIK